MKSEHPGAPGGGAGFPAMDKRKSAAMFGMPEEEDGGDDEMLAVLGYKVRASDMADVAQKLEQLEMVMGGTAAAAANDDASIFCHLASDTVHYNPSDLSTWLDSMLSEINAPLPPPAGTASQSHHFQQQRTRQEAPRQIELPQLPPQATAESSVVTTGGGFPAATSTGMSEGVYDLKPIPPALPSPTGPGRVSYGVTDPQPDIVSPRDRKRMRMSATSTATTTCSSSSSSSRGGVTGRMMGSSTTAEVASISKTSSPPPAMPVVVVDSQEAGIRLVHALMACAEAVQQENVKAADALVKQITVLAASQGGAMRKVAGYFAEALARRIYRPRPADDLLDSSAFADLLHMHFYESCPYLKFAHFTANQAILEAFAGCRRVHVIDFGMKQGMQWPALLQALALRPGGPPSFRLTGIGPPQPDHSDALQQVGWKLAHLAETIHVDFRYRGFVASSLADLEPYMLESPDSGSKCASDDSDKEAEVVAVNSVFELHPLLARPAAVEKVLATVRALRPRIVTVVEQEANHNAASFVDRFTEALHYYSTMFDSLEGGASGADAAAGDISSPGAAQQDQVMSEVYLGRQICNVVACEGADRTERHERLDQWASRMNRAGFEPVHLGSNAYKQASMLLALYAGGDGYRVEEKDGCLTLGWHTRPLIATSAWRVSGGNPPAVAGR